MSEPKEYIITEKRLEQIITCSNREECDGCHYEETTDGCLTESWDREIRSRPHTPASEGVMRQELPYEQITDADLEKLHQISNDELKYLSNSPDTDGRKAMARKVASRPHPASEPAGSCEECVFENDCPKGCRYVIAAREDEREKVLDSIGITEIIGLLVITEGFVPTAIRSEVMRLRERLQSLRSQEQPSDQK